MKDILIVDDEKDFRVLLSKILKEYTVREAEDGEEALTKIKEKTPSLVLLDLKLPGRIDGLEVLKRIHHQNPETLVIILTGYGEVKSAVKTMKLDAYDYLTKPINNEELLLTIKRALQAQELKEKVANLELRLEGKIRQPLVGNSPPMQKIHKLIGQVSVYNTPVLLEGETGTGKELVAHLIHQNSPRRDESFVVVDCASLPESLVESELFGHEKGAFTGADIRKSGRFELAEKGTLFLDEIGNLSPSTQAKLLRVLEQKEIQHLGGKKPIKIDVRLIAATNQNLRESVKKGSFRRDLYHRLNTFVITLPPLREKREDILLLSKYFLNEFNKKLGKRIKNFSPEAIEMFSEYSWPGNVRELKNSIEHGIILADKIILPKDLPVFLRREKRIEGKNLKEKEKEVIKKILIETNWKIGKSAEILGISRKTLYNKIKKYNLSPSS